MPPVFEFHTGYYGAGMLAWMLAGAVLMVCAAAGAALFLLKGWGLYRIARRRGLKKAWLSWIPVGQNWIRGSLSDQYQYLTAGKTQSRRVVLTVLSAASVLLELILTGNVLRYVGLSLVGYGWHMHQMSGFLLGAAGLGAVSVGVGIAKLIFHHLCMYDIYNSTEPRNGLAMTVLGVVVPVLEPFFLVYVKEKDEGMPPRKDAQPRQEEPVDAEYVSASDGPEQL